MLQRTIKKSITCSGVGLHSGRKVYLTLRPADEDSGISFLIKGRDGERILRPAPEYVVSTGLATTLGINGCKVATVEHILAAIYGLLIDNIVIEVEGDEVPIMDGSAASFVLLLRNAGIREQAVPKKVLALKKEVKFSEEGRWIKAGPAPGFFLDYTICFDHPLVGEQRRRLAVNEETFGKHISRARTFGFLKDVEFLQKSGLARGGSLENAVVLDEYGVVNPEGLRFDDEFVRHKMLDFIGDMALLDHPLWGVFEVYCSGHALNNKFLRFLNDNKEDYLELIPLEGGVIPQTKPASEVVKAPVPVWT